MQRWSASCRKLLRDAGDAAGSKGQTGEPSCQQLVGRQHMQDQQQQLVPFVVWLREHGQPFRPLLAIVPLLSS